MGAWAEWFGSAADSVVVGGTVPALCPSLDGVQSTVLVTGASGLLGYELCQLARHEGIVHGTTWKHPVRIPGVTLHRLDLTDRDAVRALFAALRPDCVIHAAAQRTARSSRDLGTSGEWSSRVGQLER